jgi:hypothetical protein
LLGLLISGLLWVINKLCALGGYVESVPCITCNRGSEALRTVVRLR